jgi:hypothetical protein
VNIEARRITDTGHALTTALVTVNKESAKAGPSKVWWRKILMAEHSPIRTVMYKGTWKIPKWVSTHFVRHKIGVEHYVSTSRPDRTGGQDRAEKEKEVTHVMYLNPQAIINISRKRLCKLASPETTKEWREFLDNLAQDDPELVALCVPECIYRGFCPEFKPCGYQATDKARCHRLMYLDGYADREITALVSIPAGMVE